MSKKERKKNIIQCSHMMVPMVFHFSSLLKPNGLLAYFEVYFYGFDSFFFALLCHRDRNQRTERIDLLVMKRRAQQLRKKRLSL